MSPYSTLETRFNMILDVQNRLFMFRHGKRGFWEWLAEQSHIPSARWRAVFNGVQGPTCPMIQVIARLWPQYSFWLASGLIDACNGHVAADLDGETHWEPWVRE